ncbi:permease [Alphaproteobacteria bacterium]|nr:permease [Alphaproteobacteria bacterium]
MMADKIKDNKDYKKLDLSFYIFIVIGIISGIAVLMFKGNLVFFDVLKKDLILFISLIPIIIAGILLGGFIQVLLPDKIISKWLGTDSGFKGIFIATILGAITPGGPLISFPLVLALRSAGADLGPLLSYITAWSCIALNRTLIWEIAFMGPEFSLIRVVSSLVLPLIVGTLANKFYIDQPFSNKPLK